MTCSNSLTYITDLVVIILQSSEVLLRARLILLYDKVVLFCEHFFFVSFDSRTVITLSNSMPGSCYISRKSARHPHPWIRVCDRIVHVTAHAHDVKRPLRASTF